MILKVSILSWLPKPSLAHHWSKLLFSYSEWQARYGMVWYEWAWYKVAWFEPWTMWCDVRIVSVGPGCEVPCWQSRSHMAGGLGSISISFDWFKLTEVWLCDWWRLIEENSLKNSNKAVTARFKYPMISGSLLKFLLYKQIWSKLIMTLSWKKQITK